MMALVKEWVRQKMNYSLKRILLGIVLVAVCLPLFGSSISTSQRPADETSAFGEMLVSELTPVAQIQFPYSINDDLVESLTNNGGSIVSSDNKAVLSTSASANASAQMISARTIKYNPGQGGLIRFTALYSTCVAGNTQWAGIGDVSDGYFFGCNGADFSILRRQGGKPEFRTFTITTGSSNAENITITLDGDADATVAVTNTANVTLTANEIAVHDYSDLGAGWKATASGDKVTFRSFDAVAHSGTFSLSSATSAVASVAQTIAGVVPTETVVTQANWNINSASNLIITNGNVYQIRYQWLGFGAIEFSRQDSFTGDFQLVHRIRYANTATIASIDNPTLPLCAVTKNAANTTDVSIAIGSMGGFVEGIIRTGITARHGASATVDTFTVDVEAPVLTIRNKETFQGQVNRVDTLLSLLNLSQDSVKTSTVLLTFNATLTDASFVDAQSSHSTVEVDVSATALTGGEILTAQGIGRTDSVSFNLQEKVALLPGETLTISILPNAANPDVTAAISWVDDF